MTHVYLCGLRGTGKTSVAEELGCLLHRPSYDLDAEIQKISQKSVAQIFSEGGEEAFRDIESQVLAAVAEYPSGVISLGGGAVLRLRNREIIRRSGHCVYLHALPATILDRLSSDPKSISQRPRLTTLSPIDEIEFLLKERQGFYREVAEFEVTTDDCSVSVVAQRIARWLGQGDD